MVFPNVLLYVYSAHVFLSELQRSYCAAIERRETILLTLLDRQVEIKQDMIEEARTEVAAARARIIAAREEGKLNCYY